ncbi:hypothetical protein C922_00904 [Plasmodium inui San Antonio 1]|uniref:Uncharacterized protein n=1 Tax=Plasmodium inui San Antonio 1 TaxID=1237626 RepID=W7AB70_9APIC|nr:hypothetical protein C922_00904 [Plasmodium inui San Antonio 1]EUD68508.1 hypothetical protein C922_00904 [Plasmodium inui San Antonio 1]
MSPFSLQKIIFNDNKLLSCENAPKDDAASFKNLTTSQFRSEKGKTEVPHRKDGNNELKCAPNFDDMPNGSSQQNCADHRSGPPAMNTAHTLENNTNRGYMNLIKNNVRNVISNIINRKSILGRKNNQDVREDEKKMAGEVKNRGQNSNAALRKDKNTNVDLRKDKNTSVALSKSVEFPDTNGPSPDAKPVPRGTEKKGSTSNWVRSNHEDKSSVRKTWINLKNVHKDVARNDAKNDAKNDDKNDDKNNAKNDNSKVSLKDVAKHIPDQSDGGKRQLSGRGTPTNENNRIAQKVSHGDQSRTNRSSEAVKEKACNDAASSISRPSALSGKGQSLIRRVPSPTNRGTALATKPFILGIKKNEKIPNKQNVFTSRTTHNREKYIGRSTTPNFLQNDSFQKNLKKTLIDTIMNPDKGDRTPELAAPLRTTPRITPGITPRTTKTPTATNMLNRSGHRDLLRRETILNQKGFTHGDKTKRVIKYSSPVSANSAKAISSHMKGENPLETKQQIMRRYSTAVRNRNSVLRKNSVRTNGHLSLYKLNGEGNEKKKLAYQPNHTPKMINSINHAQAPDKTEWSSKEDGKASHNDVSPSNANYKNEMASKMFPFQRNKIDGVANSALKNGRPIKQTSPKGEAKYRNNPASKQGTEKWGLHKRMGGNNEPSPLHMPRRSSTMNSTMVNKECSVQSRTLKLSDSVAKGQVKKGMDLKTGYKLDRSMGNKRFFQVDNIEKVGPANHGVKCKSRYASEGDECVGGHLDDENGSLPNYVVKGEQSSGKGEQSARGAPLEGPDQSDVMNRQTGEALPEGEIKKSANPAKHTPDGVVTKDEVYYDSSTVNSAQTKYRETDLYEDFNDTTMMVLKKNLDYGEETPSCVTPILVTQREDQHHVDNIYNGDNLSAQCVKIENGPPYKLAECVFPGEEPAYEVEKVDTQKGGPNSEVVEVKLEGAELDEAEPDKDEPDEAQPNEAEPDKAQPDKAEPDKAEPDKAETDKAEPDKAEPDKAEPDKAEPDEADKSGSSPTAQSDILEDDALVNNDTEKSSANHVRVNNQPDGLLTLLGREVAQFCTAEETVRDEAINALRSENDKVDDSDSEFITLVKEENLRKDPSSDNVSSHVQMNGEDNIPVKEEQNGDVLIRGDSRHIIIEEEEEQQGNNYHEENEGVAEIGQSKKSHYVCIRVESEDEDVITENVKIYLKSKSQEDGFEVEWGGAASKNCVTNQSVKNDENISTQENTGQVSKLAVSHDPVGSCNLKDGSKTGEAIIRGGEMSDQEGMMLEGEQEERMILEGEHEERSYSQRSGKDKVLLTPRKECSGGAESPETHRAKRLPSSLREGNNTPPELGREKRGARENNSAICGDEQGSKRGSHFKAVQICAALPCGKYFPRRRHKMVRKNNMYNFCSKYKRNYNLRLHHRKVKERKVASDGGKNEQAGTHAERGFSCEGIILGGEAYPGAEQGNASSNEGVADQLCSGKKRKIGKLLINVATPNRLLKKKKTQPSSLVKSRSPGGLTCRVRMSRGGEGRRKGKGKELKKGEIIDNDNFELAQKLMLLIFEKEEELYMQFVDVERSDTSTCADFSPLGGGDANPADELSRVDEASLAVEPNGAVPPNRADEPKNSSVCSASGAPKQREKKVSHYMQQIVDNCPSDWPLLDIAILIIVSQIVCYIFTHNKWKCFFHSCVLFEKFCIAILLNSSIINSEKNGTPILMFEHEFFCKILTSGNGELSSSAMKSRCEYLKNDHVGKEMTILDVIFLALASYITVSQNLSEYVERNNLVYYLDLFRKRARERGVEEERRRRRKRKLCRVRNEIRGGLQSREDHHERSLISRQTGEGDQQSNLSSRQTRGGSQRRPSNHSNYTSKKQRFSESLHQRKRSEEEYLCERTKRRRMTYEKNVKRRLSILRTAKCITKVENHSMRPRSSCLDAWHAKDIPKTESENQQEDNKGERFFLFRSKKIDSIVQYHTRSHLEKMLCHIVIEIFNLVYAFGEYSVENVLIIRKFFRVFLNFAQKRFIGLSVRAHTGGSGVVSGSGEVCGEVCDDLGSELDATASASFPANVRAVVPPPQRIYDNYYNVWIWVERIFSQNFYELNNLLYNIGLEKNSLLRDDNLNANYAKIETISKNVKRFSALQRRNCSVLRRYWATFGSKEGITPNGEEDVVGVVGLGGDRRRGTTVEGPPLETSMEEAPNGLGSHEWLPKGELDKENLRKHRILCKLEKRDHSKDRLTSHFLTAVECIYHVYQSMEEIPSFLHLKKKKYFPNYMGSSKTENGKGSTGIPFLNGSTNEKWDLGRGYSSPSQVMVLLNQHMDGSNNYERGVNDQLGRRSSAAMEDQTDHWIRQLKRRLKIYDIQWHEEYEKQYVNLASSMRRLKKKFKEKNLFCKIMESDVNSIWLDKNQVYLQYIQITINCKFFLGCSYDEIFQFIKGNYAFVFNMVKEMQRGQISSEGTSPPSEGGRRRKFQDDNFLLMAWEIANFYFCILYYKFELKEILHELLKWISIFSELEEGERDSERVTRVSEWNMEMRAASLLTYKQRCVSYAAHILIFLNEYTCAQSVLKQFSREFLRNGGQRKREHGTQLGNHGLGSHRLGGNPSDANRSCGNPSCGKPVEASCIEQSRAAAIRRCERTTLHAHTMNKCYLYDKWINFLIRKYNRLIPFLLKKKNIVKLILFNNKNVKILLKKKKEKVITKKVMSKMQQLHRVVLSLYCLCVKLYKGYYDHASILHFKTAQQLLVASKYLGIHIKEREVVTSYLPSEHANGDVGKMGMTLLNELPYHGASNSFLSGDGGENLFSGSPFGDAMGGSPAGGRAASEWASPGLYLRGESSPYVSPYRGKTNWDEEGQNNDDMFYLHALVLSIQIQYTLSVCIIICADLFISPAKLNRLARGRRTNKDPPAMSKPKHHYPYVRSLFNCKILRKHYRVINGYDFSKGKGRNDAKRRRKKKKKTKEPVSCSRMGLSAPMHMYYVNYVSDRANKGSHGSEGFSSGVELQTDKKVPYGVQRAGKLCSQGEESHVGDSSKDSPTDCWQDHQWSNQPDRDCLSDVVMEKTHDYPDGDLNDSPNGYLSECLPGRYENFKRSILKKRGTNLRVRDGRLKQNGDDCTVQTSGPHPVDTKNAYHILVQISTWLSKNSAAQLAWIGQKLFKMCLPELLCIVLALQANMFMGNNILTNIKRMDRILKLCAESPQLVYFAAESLKNHNSKTNRKTYRNYFSIGKRYKEIFVKRKRDVIESKEELFQLCRHLLPCGGVDKGNNHNSAV